MTAGAEITEHSAVTCLGCGCLCDDLSVEVEDNRVVALAPECGMGLRWFSTSPHDETAPVARIEGTPSELSPALDRAAELLRAARSPLIYGLTQVSTEAVRDALALADRIGARVWLDRTPGELGRVAAFAETGRVSATLGEVKNRADCVVFMGTDPLSTHPRHGERYSVDAGGRFISGREAREILVVGDRPNPNARPARLFHSCPAESECEWLTILLKLVLSLKGDPACLDRISDVGLTPLVDFARRLGNSSFGALFYGSRQCSPIEASACWQLVAQIVRALNGNGRRFVLLGMGSPGNLPGAEAALTWQGGFARDLDFRLGYPFALDSYLDVDQMLDTGEVDLICAVGGDAPQFRCRDVPIIAIAPGASGWTAPVPSAAISTARTGVESGGTVMRSDGVVLPLRPPLRSSLPSESECLRELIERLSP